MHPTAQNTFARITSKVFDVITDKNDLNEQKNRSTLNSAIETIKRAYSRTSLSTIKASEVDFSQLSYRCAYLHRHFICIVIVARRLWGRFFNASFEVRSLVKTFEREGSVDFCSLGSGPGTDLIGFYLFLKMWNVRGVEVDGVLFDKFMEWKEIFEPLMRSFSRESSNTIFNVEYEFFDFFKESPDVDVVRKVRNADVISIVKFVSAVGYNRGVAKKRLENLLKAAKKNALIFFMDNSEGDYIDLIVEVAESVNMRLLESIVRKKSRVPAGERKLIDGCSLDLVYNPQKNACVSAGIWIKN